MNRSPNPLWEQWPCCDPAGTHRGDVPGEGGAVLSFPWVSAPQTPQNPAQWREGHRQPQTLPGEDTELLGQRFGIPALEHL